VAELAKQLSAYEALLFLNHLGDLPDSLHLQLCTSCSCA